MAQLKLTTWNINSVRLRLPLVKKLLRAEDPDILCLQEIKCMDELFPAAALAELGYEHQHIHGMKAYNGVAILSKKPLFDMKVYERCGLSDRRHISARLKNGLEIHNFYIPAGGYEADVKANPKFKHKLDFLEEVTAWGEKLMGKRATAGDARILVGDLNVAPLKNDVYDHKKMLRVVSHTPAETTRFTAMQQAGEWVDAARHFVPADKKLFSWWSYHGLDDWSTLDYGRRLDHIWVSSNLKKNLVDCHTLRSARGWSHKTKEGPVGPSDHVPVTVVVKV